ncbi:MAG: hypothetical protein M1835_002552, partial [Candelina submexicana]
MPAGPQLSSPVGAAAPGVAAPVPSPYPYGDPRVNEFMYLDWKPYNRPDVLNAGKIHQAFTDWKHLMLAARAQATQKDEIFERWFGKNDNQKVLSIIKKLLQETGNPYPDAQPLVSKAVNEEKDFAKTRDGKPACSKYKMRAYLRPDTGHVHFCNYGLQAPYLMYIDSSTLGNEVSDKMTSTAGALMHEFTHWNETTISVLGKLVKDLGQGPREAFLLKDPE